MQKSDASTRYAYMCKADIKGSSHIKQWALETKKVSISKPCYDALAHNQIYHM